MNVALDDWRSAPIPTKLKAALGFLEKLTLSPGEVEPGDVCALREAGLNDRAIEEAIRICFLFSVIDRLADVFDFYVPSPQENERVARILRRVPYLPIG